MLRTYQYLQQLKYWLSVAVDQAVTDMPVVVVVVV